ncbi:MAG: hypothetical protein PHU71_01260 [Candidatus Gracilibacteria bacterium]|nr:hypothetical protein [Candidatus Gracilibacteria bacterium]
MLSSSFKIRAFSLALGIFLSFLSLSQAQAVGISPPTLSLKDVLRGTSQSQTVRIFKDEDAIDQDVTYKVSGSGEYAHYLIAPETLLIPAGQSSEEYTFEIHPETAASGKYEAELNFMEINDTGELRKETTGAATSKVLSGVNLLISFTVSGEEKIDFDLSELHINDTEINALATITFLVRNKGNVDWKPDKIKFIFADAGDKSVKKVESSISGNDIALSTPGKSTQITLGTKAALEQGQYTATANFYYNGEVVATLKSNTFTVFEQGTLAQETKLLSISTNKTSFSPGENVKLEAQVKNTGEVAATATLIAEIYDQENSVVDLIRSEELTIEQGSEKKFSEFIPLPPTSSYLSQAYTIDVYAEYGNGNKRTFTRSIRISINGSPLLIQILALFALTGILSGGFVWYKKKKLVATANLTYTNNS